MITVRYFARLRETLGKASEQIALPAGADRVAAIRALLQSRGGVWAEALAEGKSVRAAVNQEIARDDTPVSDGDEIAFFPPVTGG